MVSIPRVATPRDLPDSAIRKLLDGVLNLVYPEACVLCGAPLSRSREYGLCGGCWCRVPTSIFLLTVFM
jgi:hypothetical protein